jgi:hypothetical protein
MIRNISRLYEEQGENPDGFGLPLRKPMEYKTETGYGSNFVLVYTLIIIP